MLTYDLSQRGDESLYEYLYLCIRADIENGSIPAGRRLPSKRALAKHLGVSLITVEGAYSQLVAEGYVRAEARRGYYACELEVAPAHLGQRPSLSVPASQPVDFDSLVHMAKPAECNSLAQASGSACPGRLARAGRPAGQNLLAQAGWSAEPNPLTHSDVPADFARAAHLAEPDQPDYAKQLGAAMHPSADSSDRAPLIADFSTGSLPLDRFPFSSWAKTVREVLSRESEQSLLGDTCAQGALALRVQLAEYLHSFRGMQVSPEQIVVAAGSQVLDNLIVQLLGRERGYAVETPGYSRLASIYRANDAKLAYVPLDDGGISMPHLRASGVNVAHIMPSHQFPTGLVTSVARRYELLAWASEQPGRYIVEDDYDCEFRLSGRPIPALMSVDASSCVIYTNTFAKSLGSSFRIAYMVLPLSLVDAYQEKLGFYSSTVSATEQLALARFISTGEYERHVARTRSYYRSLKNELVDALRSCPVADHIQTEATEAGLHFLMHVDVPGPTKAFLQAARARGVILSPLSAFCAPDQALASGFDGTYVMNFAGLAPNQARPAADAIAQAVQDVPGER